MGDLHLDAQERLALCDVLELLGGDAPTLLEGWTARDIAAHLVLRERDPIAGPCMVLPQPLRRVADLRRMRLVRTQQFGQLIARVRSGPPPGFFRIPWVRAFPSLNEFFVHQEDVRRANGMGPRDTLTPELQAALWRNACRGSRYLSRRLPDVGLDMEWAGTARRITVRRGRPTALLVGEPGELLLYVFGRTHAAQVDVTGAKTAVAAVRRTHFGM